MIRIGLKSRKPLARLGDTQPLSLWLCCAVGLVGGCAGLELEGQVRGINSVIKTARDNGAYQCAPKALALAEFNSQSATDELSQGNYFRAKTHMDLADRYAREAFQQSPPERCATKDDRDGDGIPDVIDKCPNEPEDLDGFEDQDGCPDLDNDKDGLPDKEDKCPNEAGPTENEGCPDKDRDGDTVVDRLDKCPDEPGPPENQGCPKKLTLVEVKEDKIEIKEKIFFATAKAKILPRSFPLLNQVVEALRTHGKIRVRIEGHTDVRGGHEYNMRLSDARAASVRQYLLEHGIDASRLESKGYGPDQPIANNRTAAGREQNRRVEFMIIK
jgi:OOP family OmpA-OmpF porin